MFKDLSLRFETHFESLNFEFKYLSYNHFSEDYASKISRWNYYGNYLFDYGMR